jgi:hypothetical protein
MAFLDVVPAEFEALGPAAARVLATEGRICFPIRSSAISGLCYTLEQTLTITFTDGSQYEIPHTSTSTSAANTDPPHGHAGGRPSTIP